MLMSSIHSTAVCPLRYASLKMHVPLPHLFASGASTNSSTLPSSESLLRTCDPVAAVEEVEGCDVGACGADAGAEACAEAGAGVALAFGAALVCCSGARLFGNMGAICRICEVCSCGVDPLLRRICQPIVTSESRFMKLTFLR